MIQYYRLKDEEKIEKSDELVHALKDWVDLQYEQGRQTVLSNMELEEKIEQLAPGRFQKI